MRALALIAAVAALAGCAPATRVTLLPQEGDKTGAVVVTADSTIVYRAVPVRGVCA